MAMSVQILDKIQRNCQQRGLSVSRPSADLLIAEGIEISLRIVCGHANTVVIPAGELPGHADLNGMGQ